jgi:hypothetical protein
MANEFFLRLSSLPYQALLNSIYCSIFTLLVILLIAVSDFKRTHQLRNVFLFCLFEICPFPPLSLSISVFYLHDTLYFLKISHLRIILDIIF